MLQKKVNCCDRRVSNKYVLQLSRSLLKHKPSSNIQKTFMYVHFTRHRKMAKEMEN
jgi:hypothetical protein